MTSWLPSDHWRTPHLSTRFHIDLVLGCCLILGLILLLQGGKDATGSTIKRVIWISSPGYSSSMAAIKPLLSSLIQVIQVEIELFFIFCGRGKRFGSPKVCITLRL